MNRPGMNGWRSSMQTTMLRIRFWHRDLVLFPDSRKTDCDIPLLNTRWRYLSFHRVDTAPFLVNVICYITGATESGGILNNRKTWHPEGLIHPPLKLILCRYDSKRESLKLVWFMDLFGCPVVRSVRHLEWSSEWSHKGGQTTGIAEGLRLSMRWMSLNTSTNESS